MKTLALAAVLAAGVGVASAGTIYSSDFEANDGGWTGSGDWDWGSPFGFAGAPFGGPEPTGGFSGSNAWGTVIGGAHSPSTTSDLTQIFDTSGFTGLSLSFYEWIDSGGNTFDMAKVFVNGTQVYLSDGGPTSGWRQVTLDLSAFDGAGALDINFQFTATSVVERVGWYIDDVTVSGVPAPGAMALLGLGGLAMGRRRR
jgi:MYXO-CTERM domain-containing protein